MTTKPHFIALLVPVPREKFASARNRRRREAKLLDQAREITITGTDLATFNTMSETDQFLHLRKFIPDGWRPVDLKAPQKEEP